MTHPPSHAYLFDLDGTLLNTTPDIAYAVNVMRASEGLPALSESEVERGVGRGATELILATTPPRLHGRVQELREVFVTAYQGHLCVDTYPYEGAVKCLKRLRREGMRVGLVTNKPERLAIQLLTQLGWLDLFEVKLYGDSLDERKPSPKPLFKALELLNATHERCVFIGDTEVDARAAQAAQVTFKATAWGRVAEAVARGEWGDSASVLTKFADLTP